jgi:hypothetical protein
MSGFLIAERIALRTRSTNIPVRAASHIPSRWVAGAST